MAFVKKTWVDRDSEYPNRRSLTDPTTGTTEIRDIGLAEGDVYAEGDRINAENFNDLEQRIEDAIDAIPITEVEVTPVVTDGETLATIRVNEDTSDIKMPKPFEVKITYASGEYTADKTVAEIYAAAENGYEVYALYGMEMFDLAGYSRSSASFINVTNTASSKTSTIRSFVIRSNNTTTYDSKTVYNLPSISSPSSVGRIMTVSLVGSENRYSLTTDNTIDDAHTNAKRTYSSQKVNAELQARDAEIALKADTADVDTALALKADKADTYTKSQVDTALSAKANSADLATVATSGNYADLNGKPTIDTAMSDSSTNAVQNRVIKAYVDGQTTDVSVQQTLTEGTEIGGITVDGVQTKLYAPTQQSEIDDTIIASDKAWSSEKTNTEIEDAIVNILPTDTVSGSIASFPDGANNAPVKSLVANIVATQDLHGQSSPYPSGGQLWDEECVNAKVDISTTTGELIPAADYYFRAINYIPIMPNTTYYDKNDAVDGNYRIFYYDNDKNYLSYISHPTKKAFTTPSNAYYMLFRFLTRNSGYEYENNISINYPATDTSYHPYSNICPIGGWDSVDLSVNGIITTINLGGTYYGGVLDVTTGVLTVGYAKKTFIGSNDENWLGYTLGDGWQITIADMKSGAFYNDPKVLCDSFKKVNNDTTLGARIGNNNSIFYLVQINSEYSITNLTELKTWLSNNPVSISYPLAEPFEVQLTPTEVRTLLGNNNIFADTGDVEVEYRADIGLYIAKKTA